MTLLDLYEISKTKAELFLWEHINSLDKSERIEVCAINPVLVVGPSLSDSVSISNRIAIKKLLTGSIPFNPKISISLVDVKDVALAHIRAMKEKNAAGKRFLLSEKTIWCSDISNILYDNGFKKVPRYTAPNWLIKFLSIFISSLRMAVEKLGKKEVLHTNNTRNILKLNLKGVDQAIVSSAKQLHDLKLV
jgi:dihydroflavonol-4-reductase